MADDNLGQRRRYLCAACRATVAAADAIRVIHGATEHTRTNPHGITFRIVCLAAAPGAVRVGEPTLADTFFAPWAWAFAVCRNCSAQLGWHYSAIGSSPFWGLIADHLVIDTGGTRG